MTARFLWFALCILLLAGRFGYAGQLYWVGDDENIVRANADGSDQQTLFSHSPGLPSNAIGVDTAQGKVYWSTYNGTPTGDFIKRANLNGSGEEILVQTRIRDMTLDLANGKMYWINVTGGYSIQQSNLDGSNQQTVLEDQSWLGLDDSATLHYAGSKLYYSTRDLISSRLIELNTDGTGIRTVATIAPDGDIIGIQVDTQTSTAYFNTLVPKVIYSVNLDGSDLTTILDIPDPTFLTALGRIALDSANDLLYFTHYDSAGNFPQDTRIEFLSTDGQAYGTAFLHADRPDLGLTYVPEPSSICLVIGGSICFVALRLRRRR